MVMQWRNRHFVVWVSEATKVWDPELDNENRSVDSEGETCNNVDVNTGMDDVEDGEFRPDPNEENDRNSIRDEEPPVDEGEKSPGCTQMDAMQQLHGNAEGSVHGSRADADINVGLENHYDTCFGGMENLDNPNVKSVRGDVLDGEFNSEYGDLGNLLGENLSPIQEGNLEGRAQDNKSCEYSKFGLHISPRLKASPSIGKRTRDQRSSPSAGSTQGPNIRSRHDRNISDKSSLDINRSAEFPILGDGEGSSIPQVISPCNSPSNRGVPLSGCGGD
ncbi:hypothetical protein Hanom_Chr13g01185141 [Helianthus anomalus]